MKNNLYILAVCGLGDILSLLARIKQIKNNYASITFFLGGYGKSPRLSLEQIIREGYQGKIIKNLTFHSQIKTIKNTIIENVVKSDDDFFDASFCDELFSNREPTFWNYSIPTTYDYKTECVVSDVPEKCIAIHPLTKSGNAEGFQHDISMKRFWPRKNWKELCILLCNLGYHPTFVGYGDEDWGLYQELKDEGYRVSTLGKQSVEFVIEFLKKVTGCIATNSWTWEITSRLSIPTVCFFTKNHFFIQNHVPDRQDQFWDTCYIETSTESPVDNIINKFTRMLESRKRPEIDYDICMITYRDQDIIEANLKHLKQNTSHDLYIVDGNSGDSTYDIAKKYTTSIQQIPWADNFEIQKNNVLKNAQNLWRVWIDADERYESIFWNQLPWYIDEAKKYYVDCINVPRINTLTKLTLEELREYAKTNGWNINGPFGNWINFPDYQQRVFTKDCTFKGRTHERVVGHTKQSYLIGAHCIHPKTKDRQDIGLEREKKQYQIEAHKVLERILDEQ